MNTKQREPAPVDDTDTSRARQILSRIFQNYSGNLAIRLWNGETLRLGADSPEATLVFHHAYPLRDIVLFRDPLHLAEDYFAGKVSMEGDIYTILRLKDHLRSLKISAREKSILVGRAIFLRDGSGKSAQMPVIPQASSSRLGSRFGHSKTTNRNAIAFHYDVSNDFYSLWLDRQMIYSCAYFEGAEASLNQAQEDKLDHICRKLRLKPGDRFLDIGCGWGALIRWAARHYGVRAHGVTLSYNQYEYAQRRILEEGLQEQVTVEFKDYRDMDGEACFDKIASVGMFEHVGLKNLPVYFATVNRLLKPGGLFLNHGITQDEEGWKKTVSTKFINRYVFPDGELDTVSNIQRAMERSHFEIIDVEGLRAHYVLTLRHWVRRLEEHRKEALQHVSEATYRVWLLYMAACALQFEAGEIGVYQILAAKRGTWPVPAPLTRRDIYC
ncbi:MAG: methyltransferase domain-containing protein [Gammaproteobacteria bacterium]|nr:methyltransferase domain-containing protein [Gammaproteobacteria bacterium]